MGVRRLAVAGVFLCACGSGAPPDDPPADPNNPLTLAETGLYSDFENQILADGVQSFAPAFELWADGAAKERFVLLPEGSIIDSSNMDFWTYPVGTKLWKEFARGGERIETRLIWKRGQDDWFAMPYVWDADQLTATADTDGEEDVRGTGHDVPRHRDCESCHARQPDFVLGYSALLLAGQPNGLDELVDANRLSVPPGGASPYFVIPGNDIERVALGTLHANCGGCHHPQSDVVGQTPMQLRLGVGSLATVEATSVFTAVVDVAPTINIGPEVTALAEPGNPAASAISVRMGSRGTMLAMPPVGSQEVDTMGKAAVDAWISSLGIE